MGYLKLVSPDALFISCLFCRARSSSLALSSFERPSCGGRRWLWDFRTDSQAPWPLWFYLVGNSTNMKNRKSVAHRHVVGGIAQSPHAQKRHGGATVTAPFRTACTEAARAPYDYRLEAVETARQLHWDCTISVQSPRSLCTDLPRLAPECPYKKSHDARRQCEHIRRSP